MQKYFLIGETHGTKESPRICWEIIQKHQVQNIAIEVEETYQKEIEAYLKSRKKLEELSITKLEHITPAVLELIRKAKKENMQVWAVDNWEKPNQRDKKMAENLSKIKGTVDTSAEETTHQKKRYI